MDPESNDWCPCEERDHTEKNVKMRRNWDDAAVNREWPGIVRTQQELEEERKDLSPEPSQ